MDPGGDPNPKPKFDLVLDPILYGLFLPKITHKINNKCGPEN